MIYKDIIVFLYDYVVYERINVYIFELCNFLNEFKFDLNDWVSDVLFWK